MTAYPVGVLFPQTEVGEPLVEQGVDAAPDVVRGDDPEQGGSELGVALANRRKPSSMGLTFGVDPAVADTVDVRVRVGTYLPEDEKGAPVEPNRTEARSTEQQRERWRRVPSELMSVPLNVARPGTQKHELQTGLELRTLVRKKDQDGTVTVTVTLVNTHRTGTFDLQDAYCFFQPELSVAGPAGTRPFVARKAALGAVDAEHALSRLLYRHAPYFATGHGCSAAWDWTAPSIRVEVDVRPAVPEVRTEFVPSHEVLLTDSNPEIDDAALGMYGLGTGTPADVVAALTALLDGYEHWIADRKRDAEVLEGTEHNAVAADQVRLCRDALARMRRGVALLADQDNLLPFKAFQYANLAMSRQRARAEWIENGRVGVPDPEAGRWRPFQIAFMLLCLEGIVDPEHDDRKIADLLWFPTGGGKTEAYLGLVAFTVFHRRLRDGEDGVGVTVLMRYTLRLLTLQQFERGAALICAMDVVRGEHQDDLGRTRVSIGMWVGMSATPNKLDRALRRLEEVQANPDKPLQKENPVQLHACPWCGEKLDANDYEVRVDLRRMLIRCPGQGCHFGGQDGLPVHLVDEAVYDAHPTLIISTVDKFAAMPWRPETGQLFNRDLGADVRRPELIVQDELHLISGPLGTLTGLYETAVDHLADRPKVVASTATIRRASDQIGALFNRKLTQFPPAGLDARDSWFSVETPRETKASRRYVGLLTPATSQATLLVRTYAVLIHAVSRAQADPEVRDPYWTLVGYFNSLRLLSAAELQVLDDVQDRLELLAKRDGIGARSTSALIELSSRADSSAIPTRLKQLKVGLPDPKTLDVLLATNMISVGVDIDRLGLMTVMGQPQTTAEYIQATSRVGRRHPGLVAVMLNSARSRDRSHYENFAGFHSALYREVESTSVTPFSARARDRGLHAVIVALTRLTIPRAASNGAAADIEDFLPEITSTVRDVILDRVSSVESDELDVVADHFDHFVETWRMEADENPGLVYEAKHSNQVALLKGFDSTDDDTAGYDTLWSLRDVDAESSLFLENR
ncbi:Helicase conserved C-terminal domain-containing protein [Lentzea albidocapillata subsp. violacea]|uniref:Helicase conserved C-terminal domain-containing protein n=1 Tax=Lentzea albidocapillata subsp. violacea TaxID=128104 RepID=A0A1G8XHJ3_9PSEU|nr:Helicase conserved C-terminal domain-containing protein [Lentzea albidocapillata subsp. violacea]